jgi:hypothetical protein
MEWRQEENKLVHAVADIEEETWGRRRWILHTS